ncbi:MAG: hypothetical protein JW795_00865 [Chitinivibrionales bacterium]|nr:hypothetical protein [Chitinivibrionales bacterium]
MKIQTIIILIGLSFISARPLWCGAFTSSNYSRGGAQYLKLPAHASAAALAMAVTAWREASAGAHYNPAVLESVQKYHCAGSNTFWADDRGFSSLDMAASIGDYVVIAGSLIYAGVKAIERRNEFGTLEGFFSDEEYSVAVAAAGRLQWNIAWGVRGRYLRQTMDKKYANGMGLDCGATWQPDSTLCCGVSLLNCASMLWWSTGTVDAVLTQARLGVVKKLPEKNLTLSADIAKTLKQPVDVACGLQYAIASIVKVRGGILTSIAINRTHDMVAKPEFGAGIGLYHLFSTIDYSCTIPTEAIGVTHRLSLVLEYDR